MTFIDNFLDTMNDRLFAYERSGNDGYGQPSYSATPRNADGYPCYIVTEATKHVTSQSRDDEKTITVYIATVEIQQDDNIVLNGDTHTVVKLTTYEDIDGPSFQVATIDQYAPAA